MAEPLSLCYSYPKPHRPFTVITRWWSLAPGDAKNRGVNLFPYDSSCCSILVPYPDIWKFDPVFKSSSWPSFRSLVSFLCLWVPCCKFLNLNCSKSVLMEFYSLEVFQVSDVLCYYQKDQIRLPARLWKFDSHRNLRSNAEQVNFGSFHFNPFNPFCSPIFHGFFRTICFCLVICSP